MISDQDIEAAAIRVLVAQAKRAGFARVEDYVADVVKKRPVSGAEDLSAYEALARLVTEAERTDEAIRRELATDPEEPPMQAIERLGGVGSCSSGLGDLSSNPAHLEGFGS